MQRWIFLGLCSLPFFAFAQNLDVQRTELSFWMSDSSANFIHAAAVLSIEKMPDSQCVFLFKEELKIRQIRKKEGRLKSPISFYRKGDSLFLHTYFQYKKGEPGQLFLEYEIPLSGNEALAKSAEATALNAFVFQSGEALGEPGKFYPALAGDASFLRVNLTILENENASLPGTLSFKTDNENGTISQFWDSFSEYPPERFFLIVGDFEETEQQEIAAELKFIELDLEEYRQAKKEREMQALKQKWKPFTSFYENETRSLADTEFAVLDSISKRQLAGFFIQNDEIENPTVLQKEQNIALYLLKNDTASASELNWKHNVKRRGENWRIEVLQNKWASFSEEKNINFKRKILKFQLTKWRNENADWLKNLDSIKLDTGFFEPVLSTFQFPKLKISYRYVGGENVHLVNYEQGTNATPLLQIPAKAKLIANGETKEIMGWMDFQNGALRIPSETSPQFASVSFGKYFLGTVEENRPDTYSLYQLANSRSESERGQALKRLFQTKNPNLFSTVLGIALADQSAEIRKAALSKAEDLDFAAQQKLKSVIMELAEEESDPEIRRMAQQLKVKYFDEK